jgi:hypothetical protein
MFFPKLAQQVLARMCLPSAWYARHQDMLAKVVHAQFKPVTGLPAAIQYQSDRNTLTLWYVRRRDGELDKLSELVSGELFGRQSGQRRRLWGR